MMSELALWQQALLFGLATIGLLYGLWFRVWAGISMGPDLLFAIALSLSVTSLVHPPLFDAAASRLVERSPVPPALETADRRIADLESLPGRLIDRALEKIGYEREEAIVEPLPPLPGPFERRVRPALESLLAGVLRTVSFFCATLLLLMALSLRSSTSTRRELRTLRQRLDRLEADRPGPLASGQPGVPL
ncbi:MAG TPA: hypothetical protein VKA74_03495 [Myxococcota bacterium]|nr:hypothetical protein [Myxococcota bacterium]